MIKKLRKLYSRFSRWMDFDPPGALSSRGWSLFNKEFKQKAPIRYWFHRDFRRKFILPIKWKREAITQFIRYRTYDRYHVLKTGLEPAYQSVEVQMLHVCFNLLKDFVEVETAWSHYMWNSDASNTPTWAEQYMPFYRIFFPFRRPDLGVKHLEWAATLDDPALPPHERSEAQAVSAREVLALYNWWINVRPNREVLKFSIPKSKDGEDDIFGEGIDRKSKEYKEYRKSITRQNKIDKDWEKEDEKMLIRLVKIRQSLWT